MSNKRQSRSLATPSVTSDPSQITATAERTQPLPAAKRQAADRESWATNSTAAVQNEPKVPPVSSPAVPAAQNEPNHPQSTNDLSTQHSALSTPPDPRRSIIIRGAREHNLKNINIAIPRDQLVVITGLSGSGKSSLAFDTIYAEGQRKYVESLSAYARQFLEQLQKPDIDEIQGLPPTIAIEQRSAGSNPRSIVATTTEIYDYLRVLFARVGTPHCWECGRVISSQSASQIVDSIMLLPQGSRLMILAPLIRGQKGEHRDTFTAIHKQGFVRARIDGQIVELTDPAKPPELAKTKVHNIEAVVDRIILKPDIRPRLADSIETALKLSQGLAIVTVQESEGVWRDHVYSEKFACPEHPHVSLGELEPRIFSFNAPHGACPACHGLGTVSEFDPDLIVTDESISLEKGAIEAWRKNGKRMNIYYSRTLRDFCRSFSVDYSAPYKDMPKKVRDILMYGTDKKGDLGTGVWFEGVLDNLQRRFENTESEWVKTRLHGYMSEQPCEVCGGTRLKKEVLAVRLESRVGTAHPTAEGSPAANNAVGNAHPTEPNIHDIITMTVLRARNFFDNLKLGAEASLIAEPIVKEIKNRLTFLIDVGLGYLTLDRKTGSLSGGEAQRIRLATQVGSGLVGVCYVLDEPTIGLHQRDNDRLIHTLRKLQSIGNTVIVVEHDEECIRASDWLIDIGPGAGVHGGRVLVEGPTAELLGLGTPIARSALPSRAIAHEEEVPSVSSLAVFGVARKSRESAGEDTGGTPCDGPALPPSHGTPREGSGESLTLKYLTHELSIPTPATRRKVDPRKTFVELRGCTENNLKNIDVRFPLGGIVCITGVSGSGKSTLVNQTLLPALKRKLLGSRVKVGKHDKLDGASRIDKVIEIDQSPIGRTPRSNPATYTGVFDDIRKVFAATRDAKLRGYEIGRFSFNVKGGRCEACQGQGTKCIEMHFLPDVYVDCEVCKGKRYNAETLEIHYRGKSIADVLGMTVEEALVFFENFSKVQQMLQCVNEVGLGYIKLGQPSTQLSGGEAQRVKLAAELGKNPTGHTLYVLDEPTTGLHFADIQNLLNVLNRLADMGSTILVIEHNLDVIKCADWLIDLGPDGGDAGGRVIAEGTPEQLATMEHSYTGQYLKSKLSQYSLDHRAEK
ncbi:MAG: excinuclease ABC subunit UvrA [Tepidisphaeraceae bacterium]|jgi:excinuclease ABC subunit A